MNKPLILLFVITTTSYVANAIDYNIILKNINPKHPITLNRQDSICFIDKTPNLESSFELGPLKQKVINLTADLKTKDCIDSGKSISYAVSTKRHPKKDNTFAVFLDIPKDKTSKYGAGVVQDYQVNVITSAKCAFNHSHYTHCYYKSSKSKIMSIKREPKLVTASIHLNL